jgi:hypothetical protein
MAIAKVFPVFMPPMIIRSGKTYGRPDLPGDFRAD